MIDKSNFNKRTQTFPNLTMSFQVALNDVFVSDQTVGKATFWTLVAQVKSFVIYKEIS